MEGALSDQDDNQDLDLEDVLDDGDGDAEGDADDQDTDADSDEGPDGEPAEDKDKRIRDLMSKWQKAEARAKALEAKVSKPKGAPEAAADQGAGNGNPEAQQWIELMREQARETVYGSDPRFAEYGLDRGLIAGTTPAEMQASAKRLKELVDRLETNMRSSLLQSHGLSPEVKSGAPRKGKSFDSMSEDEFNKELARIKSAW